MGRVEGKLRRHAAYSLGVCRQKEEVRWSTHPNLGWPGERMVGMWSQKLNGALERVNRLCFFGMGSSCFLRVHTGEGRCRLRWVTL